MPSKIDNDVIEVLDRCTVTSTTLFLPTEQLDRALYVKTNKCLEALGGKWNKKSKGHVFDYDPSNQLEVVISTREYTDPKKEFQFFATPNAVVLEMLAMVGPLDGLDVLEPEAGSGAIADVIREKYPEARLTLVELDPKNVAVLLGKGYTNVIQQDFLTTTVTADVILMNPPFSRQQDVDHVTHAFSCLNPGGTLVSVVSESPFFRTTSKANAFRELVESHGYSTTLPPSSFRPSGTDVSTRLVRLGK